MYNKIKWLMRLVLIPGFCIMKHSGVFLHPSGWGGQVNIIVRLPQHNHLYNWVGIGTVRVMQCLAQDHHIVEHGGQFFCSILGLFEGCKASLVLTVQSEFHYYV